MITREQAIKELQSDPALAQLYKREKEKVLEVIDLALTFTDPVFKPINQDILLRMVSKFVVSETSHYYRAFARFLDWLLPDVDDEEEDVDVGECDGWRELWLINGGRLV